MVVFGCPLLFLGVGGNCREIGGRGGIALLVLGLGAVRVRVRVRVKGFCKKKMAK